MVFNIRVLYLFFMITGNEYRADVFKLAGFGLFTPIGKVILSIPDLKFSDFNFQFYLFLVVSVLFVYFAIILIVKGQQIADGKESKWI